MLSLGVGRPSPGRDEAHRDSGAAVVEMAFIFSILIMLLVGVVTSAIAFGQKNSIENAAREASRYAATLPEAWDNLDDVVSVAVAAAQGDLDADVDGQYICVAHTGHNQKLVVVGGVSTPSSGTCYDDGLSDSRVQVETGRESQINAALFSVDLNLNATASARYERAES
jgi:Flp pilus assembly protein TadG